VRFRGPTIHPLGLSHLDVMNDETAARFPGLGSGDVFIYTHDDGAIFVMDEVHRSEQTWSGPDRV